MPDCSVFRRSLWSVLTLILLGCSHQIFSQGALLILLGCQTRISSCSSALEVVLYSLSCSTRTLIRRVHWPLSGVVAWSKLWKPWSHLRSQESSACLENPAHSLFHWIFFCLLSHLPSSESLPRRTLEETSDSFDQWLSPREALSLPGFLTSLWNLHLQIIVALFDSCHCFSRISSYLSYWCFLLW